MIWNVPLSIVVIDGTECLEETVRFSTFQMLLLHHWPLQDTRRRACRGAQTLTKKISKPARESLVESMSQLRQPLTSLEPVFQEDDIVHVIISAHAFCAHRGVVRASRKHGVVVHLISQYVWQRKNLCLHLLPDYMEFTSQS